MADSHVQEHIELIARHEADFILNRTSRERAGDAIASFAGSLTFVATHLLFFSAWVVVNVLPRLREWRFDPYPFAFLDTLLCVEAILLASFILMRQARSSRRSDERDHLMLQVLLLTEKETTALIGLNRQMAEQLGLKHAARGSELQELSQPTSIDEVAETIRENLPLES